MSKIRDVQDPSGYQQTRENKEKTSYGALRTRPPDKDQDLRYKYDSSYGTRMHYYYWYGTGETSFYSNDKFSHDGERVLRTGVNSYIMASSINP